MRVVLEVDNGPLRGRRFVLLAGQRLQVGRTERADVAFPHDGRMSSVHFLLEAEHGDCYVRDLNSTNGTFLNGCQLAEKSPLHPGDQVRAGETIFVVQPGDDPAATGAFSRTEPALALSAAIAAAAQSPPAPSADVSYTMEKCDAGPVLYRGSVAQVSPGTLAARLGAVYPLFLVVDFRKLPIPRPQNSEAMDYLFDWLSPEAAAIASPVLFSAADVQAWPEIVDKGWDADAVVCLFSKLERAALCAHFRHALRGKRSREGGSAGMFGYCWPSVLAMLLAHGKPSPVAELLTGIEAVLVEMPDLPETWQLYAQQPITEVLDRLGFVKSAETDRPAAIGG